MARLVINRYLKILIRRTMIEIMNIFEYRTSFLMGTLGTYGYTLIEITFIYVLINQFETIGGWGKYEILMGFITMQFTAYIYFIFFQGADNISDQIRTGKLDMFLTKPINLFFSLNTQVVSILYNMAGLILQVVLFCYCFMMLNLELSPMLLLYIVSVLMGTLILNFILLTIQFLAFWIVDPGVLFGRFFYEMYEDFARYPATIFKDPAKMFFLTLFPISAIAYIPTYLIVKGLDGWLIFIQMVVLLLTFLVAVFVYKLGLKSYTGASS